MGFNSEQLYMTDSGMDECQKREVHDRICTIINNMTIFLVKAAAFTKRIVNIVTAQNSSQVQCTILPPLFKKITMIVIEREFRDCKHWTSAGI